jgi:predicted anti-sigma-YlaC factor YlaD
LTDPGLRCIEVVELVSDYLDGALDSETRERVEEHLVLCPACRIYVEQVRETVRALGQLPAGALSEQAVSELEAAFRAFPRGRP